MQYKTMMLELLQQRPQMHERASAKPQAMLETVERYATN